MLLCAVVVAAAPGCGRSSRSDARAVVAVSVPPHAWLVEALADDLVEVVVMLPPGASPATYQPTLGQLRALDRARLYVAVGHPDFPFEKTWLDRLTRGRSGLDVVDTAAGFARGHDPHVWLDPAAMRSAAGRVAQALGRTLPDHAEEIAARLAALRNRIDALDRDLRDILSPFAGRSFYVYHPAWGHFARAYGLVQVAIEHEHKPPSARWLRTLIERARAEHVRVIFVDPESDAAPARTLAAEIGARVEVIDPLARDWDDNLREVAHALARSFAP